MENRIENQNELEKFKSDEEVVCDNISLDLEYQIHPDVNNENKETDKN